MCNAMCVVCDCVSADRRQTTVDDKYRLLWQDGARGTRVSLSPTNMLALLA